MGTKGLYVVKNIVLIGASAGGLEPLQAIITALPSKLKNTAIVIAQHTSPNYESMLVHLLKKNTNMEVLEASDKSSLEPGTIYTCPADTNVSIIKGKFKFSKPPLIGPKPSVDKLFTTAARSFRKSAIGIVISGTGHDGSKGIVEIKKVGGFTIAQDPETAKYPGMPDSAILTDMVDLILSPEQIGKELPKLLDPDYRKSIVSENDMEDEQIHELASVKKILGLLRAKTGCDFTGYKTSTIHRRLEKRIRDKKYTSVDDYILEVEDNPDELDNLFLYLLIGVTQFFRNPESMEVLEEALKISLATLPPKADFRAWVPGCATGEEAYTIAMILDRLIKEGSPEPESIQIFATDIDQTPLSKARIGKYPKSSLTSMPEYYRKTYFTNRNGLYHISGELKKNILFSKHDLTSNPPFLKLNLVSCRNLLIYFKTPLQNQILPLFHYTLLPEGLLFLGKSETIGRFKNLFETIDLKNKLYRRKEVDARLAHIPTLQPLARPKQEKTDKNLLNQTKTIPDLVKETFYNGYEFPYVVVDEALNIVEINKDVSFFMSLQHGPPNFSAAKLIHKDLRLDLRNLIGKSYNSLSTVTGNYHRISRGNETQVVRLKVQPLLYSKPKTPYFIVTFETADPDESPIFDSSQIKDDSNSALITELEHELATTKEHLNTLIEELETSNEELQSLNEELQSSNEELQASNEELETSNEELQATNEELNIAYTDLRTATTRIEEETIKTKISENNLKSVLDNTQQGFILINRNYQVQLFNNHAYLLYKQIFNVRITEQVSYIDILPGEYLPGFKQKFTEALNGKQSQLEQEVRDTKGLKRYLSLNYTPVEAESGKHIDMVTLSLIEITDKKNYEIELEKAYKLADEERQLWKNIFEDSPEPLAIFSGKKYTVSYCNDSFKSLFPATGIMGKNISEILPDNNRYDLINQMDKAREMNKSIQSKEVPLTLASSGNRHFRLTFIPITEKGGSLPGIALHAVDVTPHVKKRLKLEQEKHFMKLVSENIPEHVWVVLPSGKIQFVNQSGLHFYGLKSIVDIKTLEKRVHPEDLPSFRDKLKLALEKMKKFQIEYRIRDGSGKYYWHMLQVNPMADSSGKLLRLVASSTDINTQKVDQKNKDDFIAVASHELKTPLTSVKAYVQLIQEQVKDGSNPLMSSFLEKTNQSIQKLEKFISDLLDVTRIQNGKLSIEKKVFDLNDNIRNLIENIQLTIKTHQLVIESGKKSMVNADKARIEQVLINLISNAVKFSPDSGKIFINIGHTLENVEVSVKDSGVGIPKQKLNNIFDRFYRVSEHKKKIGGMGIGLSISKEIIHLHGGRIWVESTPNKGSIFYFSLPLLNKNDE